MIPPILEKIFMFFLKFFEKIKNFWIKYPDRTKGIANPNEYKLNKINAFERVSSIDASAKIEPSIGPIHGVQPKPKARPIMYGNNILFDFFASNLLSVFNIGILINPNNCNEKIIIIIPATILKVSEFFNKVWPKNDADAPNKIKTVEKPKQNKTNGTNFTFFFSKISFNDWPEINDI